MKHVEIERRQIEYWKLHFQGGQFVLYHFFWLKFHLKHKPIRKRSILPNFWVLVKISLFLLTITFIIIYRPFEVFTLITDTTSQLQEKLLYIAKVIVYLQSKYAKHFLVFQFAYTSTHFYAKFFLCATMIKSWPLHLLT